MRTQTTAMSLYAAKGGSRRTMKSDLVVRILTKEEDEAERAALGLTALQSRGRAVGRVFSFLALTVPAIPIMLFLLAIKWRRGFEAFPLLHHGLCMKLLGFRTRVRGEMATDRPVLFVSNHTSYLDIPLLGAVIPGCFIAKSEVADWPLFGFLARLQRTIFVSRKRGGAHKQAAELADRAACGDNLILFAEGTSNDGNRVLPFKSSLFSVAETPLPADADGRAKTLLIQPVSIAYPSIDGLSMGRYLRPYFAWYGDMELVPHLLEALSFGAVDVEIAFHDPVRLDRFESRKALASYCQTVVASGVAETISGRRNPAQCASVRKAAEPQRNRDR